MTEADLDSDRRSPGPEKWATETVELGSVRPVAAPWPPGTVVGGRYRLGEILGAGGFGLVYRAFDRHTGGDVALKVLRPTRWSAVDVRRFSREAGLVKDIEDPGLVRILDSGCQGDCLFLTMELVRGETLADRVARSPLPVDEVVRIARAVLGPLGALHCAGVIHRDVKPSNILLGPGDRVRLGDFGLARRWVEEETRATASDTVTGTVEYLSPEQALAEELDARSDLYSLGVTLFEALTGELPGRRRRSSLGTLLARLEGKPAEVRELRPEVPARLAAVLRRLLARRPEERYSSAESALRDLERRRLGPTLRWPRVGRPPWKTSRLVAGVAATLLGLIGAGGLGLMAAGSEPELVEVVGQDDELVGVGRGGRILWHKTEIAGRVHRGRLRPGEGDVLVGVLRAPEERWSLEAVRVLSVLNPGTGEILRTVDLPTAEDEFPDFSRRYSPRVSLVDLDGDAFQEVVVSYYHKPYWPSFVVVHEPLLARSRVAIASSGHLHYQASFDVDGDGAQELLLKGFNNRMGMTPVLAAVDLVPPVNQPAGGSPIHKAETPDTAPSPLPHDALLWYKLLPRRFNPLSGAIGVDRESKTLSLPAADGPAAVLDFDGFALGETSELVGPDRLELRKRAYRSLLEARRIAGTGFTEDALQKLADARDSARRAGDPELVEHVRRSEGKTLVAAGRFDAAERLFGEILSATEGRAEVAFDAARAFHRAGELERAVPWYWKGLGPKSEQKQGRAYYELVGGILFALEELGRLDEAAATLDRLEGSLLADRNGGSIRYVEIFRNYLSWRRGRGLTEEALSRMETDSSEPDIFRYLVLELRFAAGHPAGELLPLVDREVEGSTETVPMLLSLRAALLHRLGRKKAAHQAALRASREIDRPRDDEIYSRVFRDLVERRGAAISGVWATGPEAARTARRPAEADLRLAVR